MADEDDLRTMVREFRSSVTADLGALHRRVDDLSDEMRRRLDDFGDEVRRRLGTAETAIINEIRDLSGRLDSRLERHETRIGELEGRMGGLEGRLEQG